MFLLKKHSVLTLACFALGALALAAQATYSLARVAKVGDEAEYKFTATLDFAGEKIEITGKNVDKVTAVEADGSFSYESTQTGLEVKTPMGSQAIDEESKTTMTLGADRVLKGYGNEGDEDASTIRITLLGTVKRPDKPVKIGDKWSATLKYDNKETFPVKADYEVIAEEKIGAWDTVKVKINAKETEGESPASAEGFIWIVLADGTNAKEEMTFKNAPFPMSPDPINMTAKIERVR